MRHWVNRLLVVAAASAAVYAGAYAVRSALATDHPAVGTAQAAEATLTAQTVKFGHDRVVTHIRSGGMACFKVMKGSSTVARSCFGALAADEIVYASSRSAVGGRAGSNVKAVIVRLTQKGTVWATLHRGAFFAAIPPGHRATQVIKVLANGDRETFTVRAT